MHVLMTAEGILTTEQQRFVKGLLEKGMPNVCILGNGYQSLQPFFVDAELVAAGDQGPRVARELIQKGIGNLQNLWNKAPSRQALWERVAQDGMLPGNRQPATFDRAPLPPEAAAGAAAEPRVGTSEAASASGASLQSPESSASTDAEAAQS
mmetsp:Transcript_71192/g.123544  ORF Transcript_71192/g.123544 Transcript_71192/m.123544 type:complete len:152 (+) Transcript_71192:170-625(+)